MAEGRALLRASWSDIVALIASAHVHTVRRWGPDRIVGFSPIPAMSMVSYTAATRFLSLIGGVCLSFYDWYADLPPASPQTWGDQTDVPESADWWNSSYMVLWGSNIPLTRTPDAHFMTEARYRGTKVVVVSLDYAGHTKFADHWLPAVAGTEEFASPAGNGALDGRHLADCVALGARLGWLPMNPTFDRNPLDLADEARAAGAERVPAGPAQP